MPTVVAHLAQTLGSKNLRMAIHAFLALRPLGNQMQIVVVAALPKELHFNMFALHSCPLSRFLGLWSAMCALQAFKITNACALRSSVGGWWSPQAPHTAEQPMSIHRVGGHATPLSPVGGERWCRPQNKFRKLWLGPPSSSTSAMQQLWCARLLPNPSLKRSANGRPPGPGRRYVVHFRQPGPGTLPSSPA